MVNIAQKTVKYISHIKDCFFIFKIEMKYGRDEQT